MADQGSEGFLSPFLRSRRMAAARTYLRGRVLDVGCGSGELAPYVRPLDYCGFDLDASVVALARQRWSGYRFESSLPQTHEEFDTIVALAVIEHVADPIEFTRELHARLRRATGSRIVVTTPHPRMDWLHTAGTRIGLFSAHASEEHEQLLDRAALERVAKSSELTLVEYRRFLWGANQLAIFALR
ncbi:MAG TPA: class I SAM-dependent methyltransferase [Xanthomonadaceae bacterium]|nr:class I SAM-dependent methyltransferase [Xanthomonadaceae bacterium]